MNPKTFEAIKEAYSTIEGTRRATTETCAGIDAI
jgi:hypothetical protein